MELISKTGAPALRHRGAALSGDIVALLVGFCDAIIVFGSGMLLFGLYVGWLPERAGGYAAVATVYAALCVLFFYMADLYRLEAIARPGSYLGKFFAITAMLFFAFLAFLFALKLSDQYSRVWAFSWALASATLVFSARVLISRYLLSRANAGTLSYRVAIVGGGEPGRRLLEHLASNEDPWTHVLGFYDDRLSRVQSQLGGFRLLGNLETLVEHVRENRIDEIVLALPWAADLRIDEILNRLKVLPVHISLGPDLAGMRYLSAGYGRCAGVPVLDVFRKPIAGWRALLKKAEDWLLGGLMFATALPVMAVIAVAIKLDSRGPVFFRQPRFGFNNKLIDVYKFRTMRADQTDVDGDRLTSRGDSRITGIGAFLRKTSLDELPQFINVLRGEMSIVGPRPHAVKAKAGDRLYHEVVAEYAARHKVKPGITGWAQVNGWRGETHNDDQILRRVDHDLFYIENWSLSLDLKIIARTFWTVARGQNAV